MTTITPTVYTLIIRKTVDYDIEVEAPSRAAAMQAITTGLLNMQDDEDDPSWERVDGDYLARWCGGTYGGSVTHIEEGQ